MSDSDRGSQVSCETWWAGTTWCEWLLFFLKSSSEPDMVGEMLGREERGRVGEGRATGDPFSPRLS